MNIFLVSGPSEIGFGTIGPAREGRCTGTRAHYGWELGRAVAEVTTLLELAGFARLALEIT